MTACVTCTPRGPNSLLKLCDNDLSAAFPVANEDVWEEPLIDAVAPVNMRVGGCLRSVEFRRSGRMPREKRKAPRLCNRISAVVVTAPAKRSRSLRFL